MSEKKVVKMNEWNSILDDMKMFMGQQNKVDSRIRILTQNMFASRDEGWTTGKEEGPLKLKDLHQKVKRENQGFVEPDRDFTVKKKTKVKDKRNKPHGNNIFGSKHIYDQV